MKADMTARGYTPLMEDMDMKGFSVKTQMSYVRAVAALATFCNRSPDQISDVELRSYFVHLKVKRKLARQTVTGAVYRALRGRVLQFYDAHFSASFLPEWVHSRRYRLIRFWYGTPVSFAKALK